MTGLEIYIFVLCLIVFTLLTAMFSYLISCITKMEIQFIRYGHRDEEIKKEREKELNKNKNLSQVLLWFNRILSLVLCLVLISVFAFAMYVRATEDKPANGIPSIKVVKTESMAKKNPKNEYLYENNLNDQFQAFDIVICHHLPAEEDLELYDVVIYKKDDIYIIHRIVGIEEPNEKHPNERRFLLQGDAVDNPDSFPVLYSQMQGIYEGERIQYVGSFLLFLQSPAGWLCLLLIIFGMIIAPFVDNLIEKEKRKRLAILFPEEYSEEKEVKVLKVNPVKRNAEPFAITLNPKMVWLTPKQIQIYKYSNQKTVCEVGTGVLDNHYQDGDTVDISSLKEKMLINLNSEHLRIISTSEITKRLTVYADSCTELAYRAIVEAGGSVNLPQVQEKTEEAQNV